MTRPLEGGFAAYPIAVRTAVTDELKERRQVGPLQRADEPSLARRVA